MVKLKILKEGEELQSFDLKSIASSSISLGRSESCDIRLNDRAVGREHAVLIFDSNRVAIQKKSKFGKIFLNGVEKFDFEPQSIKLGDVINIADYQLTIEQTDDIVDVDDNVSDEKSIKIEENTSNGSHSDPVTEKGNETPLESKAELSLSSINKPDQSLNLQLKSDENNGALENQPASDQAADQGGADQALNLLGPLDENPLNAQEQSTDSNPVYQEIGQGNAADEEHTTITPSAQVTAQLVFQEGAANTQIYQMNKSEVSIGRDEACDIVIFDKKSSRKNSIIRKVGIQYVIQDLSSSNGTFVNGEQITELTLSADDKIRIGETEFVFKAESAEYFEQQKDFIAVPAEEVTNGEGIEYPSGLDTFNPEAVAGLAGNAIPGVSTGSQNKKETLLEKFKRQPLPRKILIVGVIAVVFILAMDDDKSNKKKTSKTTKSHVVDKTLAAFNALPEERKQFVINTYALINELYVNKDYEKTIKELDRLFEVLPLGYRDSKDIQNYAKRAIDAQKAEAEERRRKEEEEKLKARKKELILSAEQFFEAKQYERVKEIFPEIFQLDPDNATILRIKSEIEEIERRERQEIARKEERENAKRRLENLINEGKTLLAEEKFYELIDKMVEAPLMGSTNEKLLHEAQSLIAKAKEILKSKAEPFLSEGRAALQVNDLVKARKAFSSALLVDYKNKEAIQGLNSIRIELHERAKRIYSDAIILESISDYRAAEQKYKECFELAMPEDEYSGRCSRGQKRFQLLNKNFERNIATTSDSEANTNTNESDQDPQKPELPVFYEDANESESLNAN